MHPEGKAMFGDVNCEKNRFLGLNQVSTAMLTQRAGKQTDIRADCWAQTHLCYTKTRQSMKRAPLASAGAHRARMEGNNNVVVLNCR